MMETNQAPQGPEQPAEDHLLEDLAAFTGLFNPEIIWQEKELLDGQEESSESPVADETTGQPQEQ